MKKVLPLLLSFALLFLAACTEGEKALNTDENSTVSSTETESSEFDGSSAGKETDMTEETISSPSEATSATSAKSSGTKSANNQSQSNALPTGTKVDVVDINEFDFFSKPTGVFNSSKFASDGKKLYMAGGSIKEYDLSTGTEKIWDYSGTVMLKLFGNTLVKLRQCRHELTS